MSALSELKIIKSEVKEVKNMLLMLLSEQHQPKYVKLEDAIKQTGLTRYTITKHQDDADFARKTTTGRYEYNVSAYKRRYQ